MATKDEQEILTLEHYLQLKAEGFEFEGQSYLFWEYMRLLNETKPKYFLLENVEMGEKWGRVLSKAIGVNGIHINSALVSAQNRKRIYWTNIGHEPGGLFGDLVCKIQQPKDKGILLKDILEKEVDEKYYLSEKALNRALNNDRSRLTDINYKCGSILANQSKQSTDMITIVHNTMPRSSTSGKGGTGPLSRTDGKTYCLDTGHTNAAEFKYKQDIPKSVEGKKDCLIANAGGVTRGIGIYMPNSRIRRLTPTECERLQTVKDGFTAHVSDSQRYKMLGNGWTVDVIVHILNYMKL